MPFFRPKYARNRPSGPGSAKRFGVLKQRLWSRFSRFAGKGRSRVRGYRAASRASRISSRRLLLVISIFLGVLAGGEAVYRRLAASDVFRLTDLVVHGNRIVDRREIIARSGLHQGVGLLGFDFEAARQRIEELAWIETARLDVAWPSRVEITVREHRVLALVQQAGRKDGELWYLDARGCSFAPVRPGQEIDYPVITGPLADEKSGQQDDKILRDRAVTILRLAARGNAILPVQAISEIHCDRDRGLILYLVDYPFPIYMGREDIRTRYFRLIRILGRLYRNRKIAGIREIHMDYMENKALVAMIGSGR